MYIESKSVHIVRVYTHQYRIIGGKNYVVHCLVRLSGGRIKDTKLTATLQMDSGVVTAVEWNQQHYQLQSGKMRRRLGSIIVNGQINVFACASNVRPGFRFFRHLILIEVSELNGIVRFIDRSVCKAVSRFAFGISLVLM
jgi:hypothetical protein